MGWKEWSYTKKGGIIGLIIGIIWGVLLIFCSKSCGGEGCMGCGIFFLPSGLLFIKILANSKSEVLWYLLIFGGNLLSFFLLGVIVAMIFKRLFNFVSNMMGFKNLIIYGLTGGIILFGSYYLVAMNVESTNLVGKWQINWLIVLIGAIIGSLIGFIIGKIKNKKKNLKSETLCY